MKIKYEELLTCALYVAVVVFFLYAFLFRSYVMDDSYIGYRFSKNFADGNGLVWNPGDDPVQGYSNFLWTVLAGIFMKLSWDYIFWMKMTGIVFSLLGMYLTYLIGMRLFNDKARAMIPVILMGMTVSYGFWAVGSMEVNVFIAFMLAGMYYSMKEIEHPPAVPVAAFMWVLCALTRHEGAVIFTITWFFLLSQAMQYKDGKLHMDKKRFIYLLKMGVIFSVPYLGYLYWSNAVYGYPLPAPFYGKRKAWEGISAITHFLKTYWPFGPLALLGLLVTFRSKLRWFYGYLATTALTLLLLLVNRDTIMNVEFRLTLYVLVLFYILSVPALKFIAFHLKKYSLGPLVIILGFILLMVVPIRPFTIHEAYDTHMRYAMNLKNVQGGIGLWINETAPKNVTVSTVDAGILLLNSERRAIDHWGLSDEYIAHNGFDLGYFWSQHPDIIVMFSIYPDRFVTNYNSEVQMVNDPYFRDNFELIYVDKWAGQDYCQWVFARKELNLTSKAPKTAMYKAA